FCSCQLWRMRSTRCGPIPLTSERKVGDWSMTSRVRSPKRSTIRLAYAGPIPLMSPEPRYLAIPAAVCGAGGLRSAALNGGPCVLSVTHWPRASMYSPATTLDRLPTTVTRSRRRGSWTLKTTYPLSRLWKVIRSTTPVMDSPPVFMRGGFYPAGNRRCHLSRSDQPPRGPEEGGITDQPGGHERRHPPHP